MSLELSPDQAIALDLGFRWAQISREEIVSLADKLIVSTEGIPSCEICELAVCSKDYQISDILAEFIQGVPDKWSPVKLLIKDYIKLSQLCQTSLYKLYRSISNYAEWDDPEPWRSIKCLEHELEDVIISVYGKPEQISDEMYKLLTSTISADT